MYQGEDCHEAGGLMRRKTTTVTEVVASALHATLFTCARWFLTRGATQTHTDLQLRRHDAEVMHMLLGRRVGATTHQRGRAPGEASTACQVRFFFSNAQQTVSRSGRFEERVCANDDSR